MIVEHSLTRRGDYTIRAVLALARSEERQKAREIAAEMDIPLNYPPSDSGHARPASDAHLRCRAYGGYRLSRSPADVSLLEVVELAEGPIEARACALLGGPCDWEQVCPLHETWDQSTRLLRQHLAGTDFAELAAIDELIEEGRYQIEDDPTHAVAVARRGVRRQQTASGAGAA